MPFTENEFKIMLMKFIENSKAHKDEMLDYVMKEKFSLEEMKEEMRKIIKNKEDKRTIEGAMFYLKQHKLNYDFMENRLLFWMACENVDTNSILKFHQKCVEWEDHAVECVTDSSVSCSSYNLETDKEAFNEETTLNICASMKKSRDEREYTLKCLQMLEVGMELYIP